MASDENILDELHFLSRKIESLEKKLDTSLAIQEDLAANFLQGEDPLHTLPSQKLDRKHMLGSCLEWSVDNDASNRSHKDETSLKQSTNEHERSTSYLIIPVGSYKHSDSCSLQTVKQSFTWSEMDHKTPSYGSRRDDQLKSDKKDIFEILECDANQYETSVPGISNTFSSFATQASLLSQSRLGLPESPMCTQWNGCKSDVITVEECLPYTSRAASEPFMKERNPGNMSETSKYTVENMSYGNAELVHDSSSLKYGLTIGIATAKATAVYGNAKCNEISSERFVELDEEHCNMFKSRFEDGKVMKKGASIEQLRPLWTKQSRMQSTHTSDQDIFDRICAHSSMSQHGDSNRNSAYNERFDFSPATDVCYIEEGNRFPYPVFEVDSQIYQHDQTNRGFVDTYAQDLLTSERNGSSLQSNRSDAFVQTLQAAKAQSKQVEMDFQEPEMSRKYEDDYSTDVEETTKNGNYRFKQCEVHCDAPNDNVIQMQISSVAQERSQAENSLMNNRSFKRSNAQDEPFQILAAQHHRESLRTKPSGRKIVRPESQLGDQVRGIGGIDNSECWAKVKTRRKNEPATTRHVQHAKNISVPTNVQMIFSDITFETSHKKPQEERYAHIEADEAVYQSPCKDAEFDFSLDSLTESGFFESLISPASDDVFFTYSNEAHKSAGDYEISSKDFNTPKKIGRCDGSESDSPYSSSLTSVSSTNEVFYPRGCGIDAPSQFSEYVGKRIGLKNELGKFQSSCHLHSPPLKASKNELSPFTSKPPSFRLSSLPRLNQSSKLPHDTPTCTAVQRRVSSFCTPRVSSPTSSVDTSELSMADTVCECQCPCECQTGISSVEDFKEELKILSKYVLNAPKKSASKYNRHRPSYFLDEEQGEMEIFENRLQRKDNETVPMLVKVILRLRKHFFRSLDSKTTFPAKSHSDINNNNKNVPHTVKPDSTTGKRPRTRKISFSPSAMLLGAIGENSAAEVKAVIEKENIDVNQLSPSGRSLLHKAAAAGDLESIHTLIQYGALVNIADQDDYPPIHSALMRAHFKCAILLIECGTDLACYTAARVKEFMDISDMTSEHLQVVLKTDL